MAPVFHNPDLFFVAVVSYSAYVARPYHNGDRVCAVRCAAVLRKMRDSEKKGGGKCHAGGYRTLVCSLMQTSSVILYLVSKIPLHLIVLALRKTTCRTRCGVGSSHVHVPSRASQYNTQGGSRSQFGLVPIATSRDSHCSNNIPRLSGGI